MFTDKEFTTEYKKATKYIDSAVEGSDDYSIVVEKKYSKIKLYLKKWKVERAQKNDENYKKEIEESENKRLTKAEREIAENKISDNFDHKRNDLDRLEKALSESLDTWIKLKLFHTKKVSSTGFSYCSNKEVIELAYETAQGEANFYEIVRKFHSTLILFNRFQKAQEKDKERK